MFNNYNKVLKEFMAVCEESKSVNINSKEYSILRSKAKLLMERLRKIESSLITVHLPYGNYTQFTKTEYGKAYKRAKLYFFKKSIKDFILNIFSFKIMRNNA